MENTFLPGTVRNRLEDLMRIRKVSQTELALKIGCRDSVLSRFLTGKTEKPSGICSVHFIPDGFFRGLRINCKKVVRSHFSTTVYFK